MSSEPVEDHLQLHFFSRRGRWLTPRTTATTAKNAMIREIIDAIKGWRHRGISENKEYEQLHSVQAILAEETAQSADHTATKNDTLAKRSHK